MAKIISDLHGNYTKLKMFIDYCKQTNDEPIVLGDFFDSYIASDNDIAETFKLAMDNDVTVLFGNHDLVYLPNAHSYFRCSGNRDNPIFFHLMSMYKDRFHGALIRDGYLLTHGGLSKKHGKPFDNVQEACDWIEGETQWYINNPVVPQTLSSIFDIGRIRGGRDEVSGIFWCSIGYENMDVRFSQVVGHTNKSDVFVIDNYKKGLYESKHVCVDTHLFHCFNTKTHAVEDFMLPEYKDNYEKRRMLERKF